MDFANEFDHALTSLRVGRGPREVGVHVLSEFVFCPRAALLAHESAPDSGNDELFLGPRLDGFEDYDQHRFAEELHQAWRDLKLWLTLLAPALLLVLIAWRLHSAFAGILVSLPAFLLAAKCWDVGVRIVSLVRERAIYDAAAATTIDPPPTEVRRVNWWSLRKAGFDCIKLVDPLSALEERLTGKPWRMLVSGNTIGVPVIRRRAGTTDWGRQHEVRIAAYCRLIERCEGRSSPFGVILFAGSYDCVIIPNTAEMQTPCDEALAGVRAFLDLNERGTHIPAAPTGRQCAGCSYGRPRRYQRGESETILNGTPVTPYTTNSVRSSNGRLRGTFHCPCGDRFKWVPPHVNAIELGIAREE